MKISLSELRRLEIKRRTEGWPLDDLVLTHAQVELAWPALLAIAEAAVSLTKADSAFIFDIRLEGLKAEVGKELSHDRPRGDAESAARL